MPWLPPQLLAVSQAPLCHWETGKAAQGGDPRARRPAITVVKRGRVGRGVPMGSWCRVRVAVASRPLLPFAVAASGTRRTCERTFLNFTR